MSNKFLLAMHYNKRRYITSIKSNFEKIQKMGQFWTEAKMNKMYWIFFFLVILGTNNQKF